MEKLSLAEETLGYQTVEDPTNTDQRYLIGPSKNVLIDQNRKVRSRPGYTRLGSGSTSLTNVRNGPTWNTSKGPDLPLRFYDEFWQVYLGTVDEIEINDYQTIDTGLSTTAKMRCDFWYDDVEGIDLALMVQGDKNIYEWSGAIAVVASIQDNSIVALSGNSASLMTSGGISGTAPFTVTSNGLIGTNLRDALLFIANPTDGQTIVFNINGALQTVHFVAAIGATAGNVLIGATLAITLANLVGLINAPGTTNANQVAFTGTDLTNIGYLTALQTDGITKAGTATYDENRFYTSRDKVVRCVRTGVEYTYTGGDYSQTIQVADSSGLVAGDILAQKVVVTSITAPADRNANTIFVFQNQLFLGSDTDENVFISKNTDYNDFTFSAPRIAGDGGLLTLTDPVRGFGQVDSDAIIFCGPSAAFKAVYQEVAIDTTISESLTALPIKSIGAQQGALNQESIVKVGNALAYLTNEVALRMLETSEIGGELQMHALSNPIKPDFDVENWTDASGIWYKNALMFTAPINSHVYELDYVEDANGKLTRFWQPPQVLPIQCWGIINDTLHGHSNSVPETYVMFDGLCDYIANATMGEPNDKVSIDAEAYYAYRTYGKRGVLKCFDEYFVEGEINAATTDLQMTLNYDYGGQRQVVQRTIDGTDEEILQGILGHNSLAQASLGTQSLSGLLAPPADARKFNVTFEIAKDDFMMLQPIFATNEIDRYWAVLAHGPNVTLSPRKNIAIKR